VGRLLRALPPNFEADWNGAARLGLSTGWATAVLKGRIMQKEEGQVASRDGDVLVFEISDAELELAAGTSIAAFTLGNCTGLGSCPA
jgi:hypothetical protein